MSIAGTSKPGEGKRWRVSEGGREVIRAGCSLRLRSLLLIAVSVTCGLLLAMSAPALAACSQSTDFDYNGACGPEFESPAWGNAPAWTDPSKYSTIQLADITGNGTDELIARNDDGLEIWTFDKSLGQWRPAIGANNLAEILPNFHSPAPTADVRGSWKDPAAFSTIQTADLYGDGTQEILADHEPYGTRVWRYTPPAGTKSINGGTWALVNTTTGVLPNPPAPSQYLSLHAVNAAGGTAAALTNQDTYWTYGANGFQVSASPTLAPASSDPAYFSDNLSGLMPQLQGSGSTLVPANLYRTPNGVAAQTLTSSGWTQLGPPPTSGFGCQRTNQCSPLTDTASPSCSSPPNCFGSDPAYYETMRVANHLLGPSDPAGYVLGRQPDGLHVFALQPYTSPLGGTYLGWNTFFPVLTALADPSGGVAPASEWSSIRTGDITGDGHTDVLALVNGQLQAWELQPNGSGQLSWNQLPVNPASTLNLGGNWGSDASMYSTFQVGPVAGPGFPDAVIARGPFGVRTWFYNLHGSGGWTSWLPQDLKNSYPVFSGNEGNAWSRLNTLAGYTGTGTSIRDVWTGPTAPTAFALSQLNTTVLGFAGCTGTPTSDPPAYPACTVPQHSSGFDQKDWTNAVNEALAEIHYAQETVDFFDQLTKLNGETFLAEGNELPALADTVAALSQAAGNNATQISPQQIWSTGLGIAGSTAGLIQPELGVVLGIASYLAGLIPSATPEVTGPSFTGTVADLQTKLADAVSDAGKAIDVQKAEVFQNYGMIQLVSQLHGPRGPWNAVDAVGLSNSMQEGFVLWAYKQLLPTALERDVVSFCDPNGGEDPNTHDQVKCSAGSTPAATGGPPGPFAILDTPHSVGAAVTNSSPCWGFFTFVCSYSSGPTTGIATQVWGAPAPNCVPDGTAGNEWTYSCNLGVKPSLSVDAVGGPANGWNFTTCTATPLLYDPGISNGRDGTCSNWTSAQANLGSSGSLALSTAVGLPRGFKVRSATLDGDRLLYEPRGRGRLITRNSGRSLGTVRLKVAGGKRGTRGGTVLGSAPGQPPITLTLRQRGRRPAGLTLSLSRLRVAIPYACENLPASTTLKSAPFTLQTALKLSDGHHIETVSLPEQWTCMRDRAGGVTGLRTVATPSPARHPGLALSVRGPRRVVAGSNATYAIRLHNSRRSSRIRNYSSLWRIVVHAALFPVTKRTRLAIRFPSPVLRRIGQLRRGKTRVLEVRLRIPAGLRQASISRVCFAAGATADSARPAAARACSAVRPRHR